MQRLLTDRSTEIPLWLRRNSDGTFVFPGAPVPMIVTETVTHPDVEAANHTAALIAEGRMKDKIAADKLRALEGTVSESKKAEDKLRREERARLKAVEKERLRANKLKQRKVFHEHFKWDVEI